MRRQAGADTIDFDTQEGRAHFTMQSPKKIDLVAIQKAAHGAGYTITTLEITAVGHAATRRCEECKKNVPCLKVEKTGQLLELAGSLPGGRRLRVRLAESDWGRDVLGLFTPKKHVPLRVLKVEEAASPDTPEPARSPEPEPRGSPTTGGGTSSR